MANASARETAYQRLRNRIINLELKPGEVLNDKELAEQMGMSRTPVREAILMLSMANLVVVRPQSGTFVTPIDLELVEVEQFTRYALEKEMLLRVCREITPEDRRQYQENLQLYQFYDQSLLPDREERMLEVDNNFHRLAFQIEGKELHFNRMLSSMHHVERFRILSLLALTDDRVYQDHLRIFQAVSGQDPAELSRQVEIHLNRWQENSAAVRTAFPQYF